MIEPLDQPIEKCLFRRFALCLDDQEMMHVGPRISAVLAPLGVLTHHCVTRAVAWRRAVMSGPEKAAFTRRA